jgi:osmotically-inducible protein OsmY
MPHVLGHRLRSSPPFSSVPFASALPASLAAFLVLTSGCTTTDLALGAGATAGVAASEERGFDGAVSDTELATRINYAWLDRNVDMFHSLNLFIYEGRVLITGVLPSNDQMDEAVALAWKENGVREVINEITVDASGRTGTFASDSYITAQLKAKLLLDRDVSAVNYSVDAVRGIVYVIGIAKSRDELERVIGYARNIRYVKKVVNHAILKDDPRRQS